MIAGVSAACNILPYIRAPVKCLPEPTNLQATQPGCIGFVWAIAGLMLRSVDLSDTVIRLGVTATRFPSSCGTIYPVNLLTN